MSTGAALRLRCAVGVFCALAGCGSARLRSAGARCPVGTRAESSRTAAIVRSLARDAEAAALLRSERVEVCFGAGLGAGVIAGDVVLFDAGAADRGLAARLAHLLVHHADRLGDGCAAGLAAARSSEARARALELRIRMQLGVPLDEGAAGDAERDYALRCAP